MTRGDFGTELKRLREDRRWSQRQLAERSIGVSVGYVGLLEKGDRRPSVETVSALATALGCNERERRVLFAARGSTDLTAADRGGARLSEPNEMRAAAQTMTAAAAHYREVNERVRSVSVDLGAVWAGDSASAYRDRLGEWHAAVDQAERALNSMAEALITYARKLDEIDFAVARSLED